MNSVIGDWGTTNLRIYHVDEHFDVLRCVDVPAGVNATAPADFAAALQHARRDVGADDATPAWLTGMIGSRHGWREAPYADTPADAAAVAATVTTVDDVPGVRIVGGVCHRLDDGCRDVMRGEEVQVFGVLADHPEAQTVCLPGTHSKWVQVHDGRIERFSTWMTGELFACISEQTVFARQITSDAFVPEAFDHGVHASGREGPLLNRLFHLRTDGLFGRVPPAHMHACLSGFLIGRELRSNPCGPVHVCGSDTMLARYSRALTLLGREPIPVPAATATVRGIQTLRRATPTTATG